MVQHRKHSKVAAMDHLHEKCLSTLHLINSNQNIHIHPIRSILPHLLCNGWSWCWWFTGHNFRCLNTKMIVTSCIACHVVVVMVFYFCLCQLSSSPLFVCWCVLVCMFARHSNSMPCKVNSFTYIYIIYMLGKCLPFRWCTKTNTPHRVSRFLPHREFHHWKPSSLYVTNK